MTSVSSSSSANETTSHYVCLVWIQLGTALHAIEGHQFHTTFQHHLVFGTCHRGTITFSCQHLPQESDRQTLRTKAPCTCIAGLGLRAHGTRNFAWSTPSAWMNQKLDCFAIVIRRAVVSNIGIDFLHLIWHVPLFQG